MLLWGGCGSCLPCCFDENESLHHRQLSNNEYERGELDSIVSDDDIYKNRVSVGDDFDDDVVSPRSCRKALPADGLESLAGTSTTSVSTFATRTSESTENTETIFSSVTSAESTASQDTYEEAMQEVAKLRTQIEAFKILEESSSNNKIEMHREVSKLRGEIERMQEKECEATQKLYSENEMLKMRLKKSLARNEDEAKVLKERMGQEISTRNERNEELTKQLGNEIAIRMEKEAQVQALSEKLDLMQREMHSHENKSQIHSLQEEPTHNSILKRRPSRPIHSSKQRFAC